MRGIKTDLSRYSEQFLDTLCCDIQEVLEKSGLIMKGNMRLTTFLTELRKEIRKREEKKDDTFQ